MTSRHPLLFKWSTGYGSNSQDFSCSKPVASILVWQVVCELIASHYDSYLNSTADCGAPAPPFNGFLQPHTNTTEGLLVVFQCDPGFVPKGEMTAVCGRDG